MRRAIASTLSRRRAAQHGFTLVELIVALMVMAVLAGLAWQGVDSMMRSRETTQAHVERTLRLSNVLAQWEQDLTSVEQTDRSVANALSFDGASVRMLRRTDAGMQVVVWALREGTLLRWASPTTTRAAQLQEFWLQSLQLLGNETGQLRALEGLVAMQVYFYRNNSWTNPQSQGDLVTPTTPAPAPTAPPPAPSSPNPTDGVPPTPTQGPTPPKPGAGLQKLPTGVRLVLGFGSENDKIELTRDVVMSPQASQL